MDSQKKMSAIPIEIWSLIFSFVPSVYCHFNDATEWVDQKSKTTTGYINSLVSSRIPNEVTEWMDPQQGGLENSPQQQSLGEIVIS